jgi:probable F420-dependent oxidoreductase
MSIKPVSQSPSIGLFALNSGPTLSPDALAGVATLAEDLGYESFWVGEHPVLPDPPSPDSPFDPRLALADPVVVLSFLAAITRRVRLATGVLLLPLRNPVILAKQLASLDVLSGGRLMVGLGLGYIRPEAAAVGVPYAERAARSLEYLAAMRSLWHDDKPAYHGRFVEFDHVDAHPRPAQSDLHVVTGGMSAGALRRAVSHAHGWYGFMLRPEQVAAHVRGLWEAAEIVDRPPHLGPLEITVTPRGRLDRDSVEEFRAAGVHRLVLSPRTGLDQAALEDYVREHAELIVPVRP